MDHGGPCHEFFRMLSFNASEVYFQGKPGNMFFCIDVAALQVHLVIHVLLYSRKVLCNLYFVVLA